MIPIAYENELYLDSFQSLSFLELALAQAGFLCHCLFSVRLSSWVPRTSQRLFSLQERLWRTLNLILHLSYIYTITLINSLWKDLSKWQNYFQAVPEKVISILWHRILLSEYLYWHVFLKNLTEVWLEKDILSWFPSLLGFPHYILNVYNIYNVYFLLNSSP